MKRNMRLISILFAICLVINLMPVDAVYAADGVSYIDATGNVQTASATEITEAYLTENSDTLNTGWYVVNGDVYITDRITVNGDVHLILSDGCNFIATKGITVQMDDSSVSNALTIYSQSWDKNTMGVLEATGVEYAAGIGSSIDKNGGTITINGGIVKATGGRQGAAIGSGHSSARGSISGGTITINNGIVETTSGDHGAGIGGGYQASGGTVSINGGFIHAIAAFNGTGIGTGYSGETASLSVNNNAVVIASSITDTSYQTNPETQGIIFNGTEGVLYGTNVTPNMDFYIPAGHTVTIDQGKTLTINSDITMVNGGTINVNGTLANHGTIGNVINQGSITGNGITGSEAVDSYTINTSLNNLYFAGNPYAVSGNDYNAKMVLTLLEGGYTLPKSIRVKIGDTYIAEGADTYTYDSNTGELTIKASALTGNITIIASAIAIDIAADFVVTATNSDETLEYGIDYIYPADGSPALTILSDKAVTIRNANPDTETTHRIYVEDDVNAKVTLAGVNIRTQGNGSPFSIADNSKGDVTVTLADGTENVLVSGSTDFPGLQKNGGVDSGTLTINGNGTLSAAGNWNGPGIGGSSTANIVIESGTIIAKGTSGAGIGSAYKGSAYNITIKGGTVTAAGGVRTGGGKSHYGAGIGSGANGSASNIVITGGSVYATAQGGAQPIGKGSGSATADVPTDGSGNRVYLYEIENLQKADIVINGNDYPDTHGEEAKIYVYLPAKTAQDPNVITVGDATTKLYYNSGKWLEVVGIPAADSTTFTYTGQEQTYTIAESDYYTISGNVQTNAGTHTVTVSLKDKNNTAWSDGTTEDKTYSFVINKAEPQEGYVPDCELTLTENTDGTFTAAITPVDGTEYSFDGQNWSNDNTKKVNHKEEVTGYIRYAATENYNASAAASKTVKAGHGTLEHYNAVEPTCTEDGNIEYYYCPVCKEYFSDAGAQSEIGYSDTVIAKKGHDFSGDFDAYNEDGHWHICNREGCTAADTPVSHSFTSYIYNNDATYFEDGTETAVCDAAGCEQTHTRTKTGTKLIDAVNPTGEITVKENKWKSFINTITFNIFCKDKYDVTITANDNETGIASVEYLLSETAISESDIASETGWKSYSAFSITDDGKYIIYAKILDKASNVTYVSSNGLVLDSTAATAPIVTTNGYNPGGWTNGDVEFTISGSTALSGIAKYQYSADNGASWQDVTVTDGSAALTVTDNSTTNNGTAYIFRAVSNSGMEGAPSDPITVKIDKTEPTIEISGNTADYLTVDTVTITPTAGVSGIAGVTVSKDNGEAVDITESYQSGYEVTENGAYTFTVTNGAGVTAADTITYTNIDRATPVVSLTAAAGGADYADGIWTNKDITLSVSNSTANLGTTKFEYSVDNGGWQTYSAPITVSEDTDGTVYTFRAISESGVMSDEIFITVKLDKTAPVISGVTNGETYDTAQKVEVTDANLESVTLNGKPVDSTFTLAGNVKADTVYTIVAADKAGNTVTYTVTMKPAVLTNGGGDNETPTDGNKDTTSPKTGDDRNIALWIALLFVSGAGVTGITAFNKKRRRGIR